MEILKDLVSGNQKVQSIREQLFDVVKVQLTADKEGFNLPSGYGIYKSTGGDCLGVVGEQYIPRQPLSLFEGFERSLMETDADMNKIEYLTFKNDARISFRAPIKTIGFKNAKGLEDESVVYLNLQTGFDGNTPTSCFLTTYRLVCSNGMRAMHTDVALKFRNTKGNTGKVECMAIDVAKALDNSNRLEDVISQLDSRAITKKQADNFIREVFGLGQEKYTEMTTLRKNKYDKIQKSLDIEFSRTGRTAWGALNGVTHYTNHVAKADNRSDYVYQDSGLKVNNRAQKLALELV